MSDMQKTIEVLKNVPEDISSKISIKEINDALTIMINLNDDAEYSPTMEDFIEALYTLMRIKQSVDDVDNGKVYTTEELLEEIKKW